MGSCPAAGTAEVGLVMTEPQYAAMLAREGVRAVMHRGHPWTSFAPGFYEPSHLLARLRYAEIGRPSLRAWGYRAALVDEDDHRANGSIPVGLVSDLPGYDESRLNRNRRRDLKRCLQQVELRRLQDPTVLVEQGYAVFTSAMQRVGYWRPLDPRGYRRRMTRRATDPRWTITAGFVDGRLAGYLESYAVDGLLYTRDMHVASDAMRTGIATGLWFEALRAAARNGTVHTACLGLDTPEVPNLRSLKAALGATVVHVPARVSIPSPIATALRTRRPAAYYRLTGRGDFPG
jgi:hypothetical protein